MRRRWLVISLIGFAVLTAAWLILYRSPEPTYQGQSLTQWLVALDRATPQPLDAPPTQPDPDGPEGTAIRHIGTSALPWLLKWMHCEPSGFRIMIQDAEPRAPRWLVKTGLFRNRAEDQVQLAIIGLAVLGSNASPAIPELTRMLRSTNQYGSWASAFALARMGRAGRAPLLDALTARPVAHREYILASMRFFDPRDREAAKEFTPAVILCLKASDPVVSRRAAIELGSLRGTPEEAVPALVDALSNPRLRAYAVSALGHYKDAAQPAVPALLGLLADPDPRVRRVTTNALDQIAPDELAKAGAQKGEGR